MDNFSHIALSSEKNSLRLRIVSLRKSMDSLKDKKADYYEHHQLLVNTYKDMIKVIDEAIIDSKFIGSGV